MVRYMTNIARAVLFDGHTTIGDVVLRSRWTCLGPSLTGCASLTLVVESTSATNPKSS